ncbi:Major facilitator superfamily and Major facilitator superfamily domain, general substrate transporter-containing protein [Strongyloides ratti]|uniref:Major facilitator superfamily and Major facilitator superfamily domain, general substrate transporter-containing protein n=1 Tax=Strongyloides ratti TaxID=34506 RepID=A0A090KV82_STRRB|nr:Major facilitator superfamily and Major facilitator superfamily domain, general substrate transporter-containing protein [Strongyloides ratti]CEF59750.1 Major facilitator superfamily and Major facilitator superfamily domain, general substrate transporter-containing protein [Strongyloides ratti]
MSLKSISIDSSLDIAYRTYRQRWVVLGAIILVNFSNAMTWISYASITFPTNIFYGNDNAAFFLNGIFLVISIPIGFLSIYMMDRWGIRTSAILGGTINMIGNILRLISTAPYITDKSTRFIIVMIGQSLASISQPFIMFLPTKMSAYWFPENQRAFSNTLASMANPLGIAFMYSMSPQIVSNPTETDFMRLNGINFGVSCLAWLVCLLITSSKPPTPVSPATESDVESLGFLKGLKKCCKSKSFVILGICLGGAIGLFNTLYNNLQPALCVQGYSSSFSGAMGAILIVSGLFGSAISAGLSAISLTIAVQFENVEWWVIISIVCFGFFGFAIYPIGLEVGVEVTFPVAEATSTGIICIMGQLEGIVFLVLTNFTTGLITSQQQTIQTCTNGYDPTIPTWKVPFIIWACCVLLLLTIFVALFWPKYKRSLYEKKKKLGTN